MENLYWGTAPEPTSSGGLIDLEEFVQGAKIHGGFVDNFAFFVAVMLKHMVMFYAYGKNEVCEKIKYCRLFFKNIGRGYRFLFDDPL